MNKAIFGSSLACVLFLLTGTFFFPNNSIMWLASTSVAYTFFRLLMAGTLLTVLLTSPPRRLAVRLLMGAMAAVLLGMGISLCLGDSMHLLDIVLFLELGTAFGVEALELNEEEIYQKAVQLQSTYRRPALEPHARA